MEVVKKFFLELGFLIYVRPMIVTFIVTMGSVYGLGRMLDVIKTRVGKNRVAFISCLLFGPLEVLGYIPKKVEDCVIICGLGILCYTLIGMKLFSRIDKIQDIKFGEDDPSQDEGTTKPTRKSKTKR